MNKPVYLGLSVLEISKTPMYQFMKTIQNYVKWIQICLYRYSVFYLDTNIEFLGLKPKTYYYLIDDKSGD